MPITADKRLLNALQDEEFLTDTGHEGGLACPICMSQLAGEGGWNGDCKHLLAQGLDGAEDWRECWSQDEPYRFDAKKVDAEKDAFLLAEEWIPVKTVQADTGGMGWVGWFAFPVSLFSADVPPTESVSARLASMEEWYLAEPEDEEECEDEDDESESESDDDE